jgi:transcriptional regulator with XRE-family HTH domain
MDMRQLVGRNVRRVRLSKGLTQEQFADRSGFSQQYLSDLERGRRNPTVVTLFELADALGVKHVELVLPDEEFESELAKRAKLKGKPRTSAKSRRDQAGRKGGST